MIFKPEMAKRIAEGRKTQTRRPIKPDETVCRYKVGRVYTVQAGRGKPGRDQITITDVRDEFLGDLSLRDAKREGFRTTTDFEDYWTRLHRSYDPLLRVWVITFARGAHTDQPRLLAARCGGPHGDYTTQPALAMKGEGESPPATILEHYAKENHEAHLDERKRRLQTAIKTIREHAGDQNVNRQLREAEARVRNVRPFVVYDASERTA